MMPQLHGADWRGAEQTVDYGQDRRPTLIYSFTSQCPFCRVSWGAMRSLQALAPGRLRIVYIDANGDRITQRYLIESGIGGVGTLGPAVASGR